MKVASILLFASVSIAGTLTGCGAPQDCYLTVKNGGLACGGQDDNTFSQLGPLRQSIPAGVYFNPTTESIAIDLDGMAPIDTVSKPATAKETATRSTTIAKTTAKYVQLAADDVIPIGSGNSVPLTIVGCMEPVEMYPGNNVTICYDSQDLQNAAQAVYANMPGMLAATHDLLGDPGNINMVVTSQNGNGTDINGTYDVAKSLAIIQYHDLITISLVAAHELGHAVFYNVRGTTEPLYLNEAIAMWAQSNYMDFLSVSEFDGGTLYAYPLFDGGYSRLLAMADMFKSLQIIPPSEALKQPDFIKALTGLDEQQFARKFWQQYKSQLPAATFSQYVGANGAIRITGPATIAKGAQLQQL